MRAPSKLLWILSLAVSFSCLCVASASASEKANAWCKAGQGKIIRNISGFRIKVEPDPDPDQPYEETQCEAMIFDAHHKMIFDQHDWAFSIEVAGDDVTGDGLPDIVFEAYSGGAHCCWTYYVFSLGPKPGLVMKFENNRDAAFYWDEESHRMEIVTGDGTFDYFDEVCHACSPFPVVYLRFQGPHLVDISGEAIEDYDKIIRDSRRALTSDQRRRLKALKEKPSDSDQTIERARFYALTIVFAYLYSGREQQALEALLELWPPFDQERIWNLILETRRNGILCYTRPGAVCGEDATSQ